MTGLLLPCPNPWCAGTVPPIRVTESSDVDEGIPGGFKIMCFYDCNLSGPVKPTLVEAEAAWNTRPSASVPPTEMVEALARTLCDEPEAREIAEAEDAPCYDDSTGSIQWYWQTLALAALQEPKP